MSDDSVPSPDHAKRGGCPFLAMASMPTDEATQTRLTQEEVEAQQKAANLRKTIQDELQAFFNRPPTRTDRMLSILPYLFLLINGLQMARFLDHPENNFCLAWIAKIHQLNQTTMFAHIILISTGLYVLDNPSIHRFVRFNFVQAASVGMLLCFPSRECLEYFYWFMGLTALVRPVPPTGDTWAVDCAFATILGVTAYGSIWSFRGKTPNGIPILSQTIEGYIQDQLNITTEEIIRQNVGPTPRPVTGQQSCPFREPSASEAEVRSKVTSPPTVIDKILSILPLLLAVVHCLPYARHLDSRRPPDDGLFWTMITTAYRWYTVIPSLIPILTLELAQNRLKMRHPLMRDNIIIALRLIFALFCINVVAFLYTWVLVPVLGGITLPASMIESGTDFVFVMVLLIITAAICLSLFRDAMRNDHSIRASATRSVNVDRMIEPPAPWVDRLCSILLYLFPLFDGLDSLRFLVDLQQPSPDRFTAAIAQIHRWHRTVPFGTALITWLFWSLAHHPSTHPLLRYNLLQSLSIYGFQSYPLLLWYGVRTLLEGLGISKVISTGWKDAGNNVYGVVLLGTVAYPSLYSLCRGTPLMGIPFISAMVEQALQHDPSPSSHTKEA